MILQVQQIGEHLVIWLFVCGSHTWHDQGDRM